MESYISIYFIMNQQQVKCPLLVIRTYILWPTFDSIVEMLQHIRLKKWLLGIISIYGNQVILFGVISLYSSSYENIFATNIQNRNYLHYHIS